MPETAPWRDRRQLERWLAGWRRLAAGRGLYQTAAGNGWLSLQLAGEDRLGLFLGALPGAVLVFPFRAPLPAAMRMALPAIRKHPLAGLLREARLVDAALLSDDLVLQLVLHTAAGMRRLRHQLFGSRGGTVLLAADDRLLWSAYGSPHPCLLTGEADQSDRPSEFAGAQPGAGEQELPVVEDWSLIGQQHLARQLEITLGDRLQRAVERRLSAAARLVENLGADCARADTGRQLRQDAESLAAHLHEIPRGAAAFTCRSPHDGCLQTLDLNPALSAAANLERLFKLARKAERGKQIIAERLAGARDEQAQLTAAASGLAALLCGPRRNPAPAGADAAAELALTLARLSALQTFQDRHRLLWEPQRSGAVPRAPDEPSRPFRRFLIAGRWEVWVGRNSRENDELTHHKSHPRDLWLHAQGVEGSHVVLRTQGQPAAVPRQVIEQAAALAAHFSKARHSGLVPVLWTERRYVRRPRRAAPGTAVCLRAKSLIVVPEVAAQVEPV